MTTSTTSVRQSWAGNGVATVFPVTGVPVGAHSEYRVEIESALGVVTALELGVGYTVSGTTPGVGTVTLAAPPAVGTKLHIRRETPALQGTAYLTQDRLSAPTIEQALDELQRQIQELREQLLLVPKVPFHKATPGADPGTSLPLPADGEVLYGVAGVGWIGQRLADLLEALAGSGAASFPLLAPAGSLGAPSYSWADAPSSGFFLSGTSMQAASAGAKQALIGPVTELGQGGQDKGLLSIDSAGRTSGFYASMSEVSPSGAGKRVRMALAGTGNGDLEVKPLGSGRVLIGGVGLNGVDITGPDYRASWTAANDIGPIIQSILDSGALAVYIPPGTYNWNTKVTVPAGRSIVGAGSRAVRINSTLTGALADFELNSDASFDTDWTKACIRGMAIHTAGGGVLVKGHEFVASDLRFHGGAAGAWAIDMVDVNEFAVDGIVVGKGGGSYDWNGNGVRCRVSRGTVGGAAVNFGDGTISNVAIKLKSANSRGLELNGSGFTPSSGTNKPLINNVLVSGVHVNAGASVPAGSIGVYLQQVSRCSFVNVDVEVMSIGWKLRSAYTGGNSGSNQYNTFVGCYALNCTSEWQDVGDTEDGGATNAGGLRNHFLGTFFIGPAGDVIAPDYGFQSNDEGGLYTARRSPVDLVFGGTTWYTLPSSGQVKNGIRLSQGGHMLVIGDVNYSTSPGSAPYDGMPKNDKPRKALGFDLGTNVARVFKPWGTAEGTDSSLAIGNGQAAGLSGAGSPATPLHHITLCDPVYFERWPAATALPSGGSIPGYGSNVYDVIVNVPDLTPLGSVQDWQGPGLYSKGQDGTWRPVVRRRGWMVSQFARSGLTYSLDTAMAGKLSEFTATTGNAVVTIDADLISADEETAVAGYDTSFTGWIKSRSTAGNLVTLTAGTGVTMYSSIGTGSIGSYIMTAGETVQFFYTRTGVGTARVDLITEIAGLGDIDGGVP